MIENKIQKPILIKDLGMKYPNENSKKKRRFGLYRCNCGNEFKARIDSVNNGDTQSCGCYQKKKVSVSNSKHSLSKHRLFQIWNGILQRTTNENHISYKYYGAVGIKLCERWLNAKNFINDMESTFLEGLTIDRINNNKGYSPDNCRWVSPLIQNRNKRKLISSNTSEYRGVSFQKNIKRYRAKITVNYKDISLGYFDTAFEAAKAYDKYVIDNNLEHTTNGIFI